MVEKWDKGLGVKGLIKDFKSFISGGNWQETLRKGAGVP